MKRITAILLALFLAASFVACDKDDEKGDAITVTEGTAEETTESSTDVTTDTTEGTTDGDTTTTGGSATTDELTTDNTTADDTQPDTPEDIAALVVAASNKLAASDAIRMAMKVDVKMQMTGMNMDMKLSMEKTATGLNSAAPVSREISVTEMLGMTQVSDVYIPGDGYAYYTEEDNCYKTPYTYDDDDNTAVNPFEELFGNSDKEKLFAACTVTTDDNGNTVIAMKLNETNSPEVFKAMTESFIGNLGDGADAAFTDMDVTLTVNANDVLSGMTMVFGIDANIPDTGDVKYDMNMTVSMETGSAVVVEAPEGYQNYQE